MDLTRNLELAAAGAVLRTEVERTGFSIVPTVLTDGEVDALLEALHQAQDAEGARRRSGDVFAMRNLLRDVPAVRATAASDAIRALVEPVLGTGAFPVRGIFFDKTAAANWKVVWHQDSKIPVRRRLEVAGFRSWSLKAGIVHVEPPEAVLERMLTVRLHLDNCGEGSGPLMVKPRSHRCGRLDDRERERWVRESPPVPCLVPRGGALVMRPLLLHASSAAREPGHRRVVHLEFAVEPLPGGLEWAES